MEQSLLRNERCGAAHASLDPMRCLLLAVRRDDDEEEEGEHTPTFLTPFPRLTDCDLDCVLRRVCDRVCSTVCSA